MIKVDRRDGTVDATPVNWWGIIVSFAFVFGFIGIAQLLLKRGRLSPSVTRKVVHIGVAHWWILAMIFFDRWEFAIVGPTAFILINLASFAFRLFPAMEHEERRRNLGTVYFPIALLICVLLTWAGPIPMWMGGAAMLVLGWGDGLASLVGESNGAGTLSVFGNRKSIAGTLSMFVAATVVLLVFLIIFASDLGPWTIAFTAVTAAAVAALVELITPFGLDNLSVPLLTLIYIYAI